jgi:hypothetical protein
VGALREAPPQAVIARQATSTRLRIIRQKLDALE